jgi:hypothetical protein
MYRSTLDIQKYRVSGLCASSGIINVRIHTVSETGYVSVLRQGEGDTYSIGTLRKSCP